MRLRDLPDAALVQLARDGQASAFASLMHRHAAHVRAAASSTHPTDAVTSTFTRAMRHLDDPRAATDTRAWLEALAVRDHTSQGAAGGHEAAAPTPQPVAPPLDQAELDEVWRELAARWPDGRVRRPLPAIVWWLLAAVLLVVLAAAIPWLVLGRDPGGVPLEELRAFPVTDTQAADPGPVTEPEPEEPLPSFEFPIPPEQQDTPPAAPPAPPPPPDDPEPSEGDADTEGDGEVDGEPDDTEGAPDDTEGVPDEGDGAEPDEPGDADPPVDEPDPVDGDGPVDDTPTDDLSQGDTEGSDETI